MTETFLCTVATTNQVAHVRVLADQLASVEPTARLYALILDDVEGVVCPDDEAFAVLTPEEILAGDFVELAARLDEDALRRAVLPALVRAMFEHADDQPVIHVEIGRAVLADLSPLTDAGTDSGMAVVPRMTTPPPGGNAGGASAALRDAVFDEGLFACRLSEATLEVLALAELALIKGGAPHWLDHAGALVESTVVVRRRGLAVGPWNEHQHRLVLRNRVVCVDDEPVRTLALPEPVDADRGSNDRGQPPVLTELRERQFQALRAAGHDEVAGRPYGFAPEKRALLSGTTLQELRHATARGAISSSVFSETGYREFVGWLNQPVEEFAGGGVSRFWWRVYSERADLRVRYPELLDGRADRFLSWVSEHGVQELGVDAAGLGPAVTGAPVPARWPAATSATASQT